MKKNTLIHQGEKVSLRIKGRSLTRNKAWIAALSSVFFFFALSVGAAEQDKGRSAKQDAMRSAKQDKGRSAEQDKGRSAKHAARGVVEDFHATLIQVMQEPECVMRYRMLEPSIRHHFNLPRVARLSAGSFWKKMNNATRRRFLDTMTRSTIARYADSFAGYDGESFRTIESNPWKSGMMVKTQLVQADGEGIRFDYVLVRGKKGRWQVVDILLKGSYSELATRRSQYLSILRRSSIEELVARIQSKIPADCQRKAP